MRCAATQKHPKISGFCLQRSFLFFFIGFVLLGLAQAGYITGKNGVLRFSKKKSSDAILVHFGACVVFLTGICHHTSYKKPLNWRLGSLLQREEGQEPQEPAYVLIKQNMGSRLNAQETDRENLELDNFAKKSFTPCRTHHRIRSPRLTTSSR